MEDSSVPLATSDTLRSAAPRAPPSRGDTFEFHECLSRQGTCDLSPVVEMQEQSGKKKAESRPEGFRADLAAAAAAEENLSETLEDLEVTSPPRPARGAAALAALKALARRVFIRPSPGVSAAAAAGAGAAAARVAKVRPRDIQRKLELEEQQGELEKEMQDRLGHRLKDLPSEGDLTSTAVVLPCGKQGWSLPVRLVPEQVFGVLHFISLICLVYGISWSVAAAKLGHLPTGKAWFFCPVVKLGYPMIPVIIGCWMKRCGTKPRMTPGYYFANLKMPLMASFGPGVLIGALGDTVVMHLCGVAQVIGRTYSAFILSFAWLTTCLVFWLLENCIIRKFASDRMRTEIDRTNWGFYSRVLVELGLPPQNFEGPSYYSQKWEVFLRPGISWTLGFIPAPRYGTFHRVSVANKLRCISITMICGLVWCMLIIAGHSRFLPDIEVNSVPYLLVHTDMHNLIMNAVTAPYLIFSTWRSEPDSADPKDQNGRPWVFFAEEKEELQAMLDGIKEAKGEGGQPSDRSASSH